MLAGPTLIRGKRYTSLVRFEVTVPQFRKSLRDGGEGHRLDLTDGTKTRVGRRSLSHSMSEEKNFVGEDLRHCQKNLETIHLDLYCYSVVRGDSDLRGCGYLIIHSKEVYSTEVKYILSILHHPPSLSVS